jgi:transposase
MSTMAKPYPKEFRDDVVAVARKGEAPLNQIAKDFGISEGCLHNWMKKADVEDGNRPGVTEKQSVEVRELKKRNRLLEQENEVLRRAAAYLSQANLPGK